MSVFGDIEDKICSLIDMEGCNTNPINGSIFMSYGKARVLTDGERSMLYDIFGDDLDPYAVRIVKGKFMPIQYSNVAMTPKGTIFFAEDVYLDDFSVASRDDKHFFVHEMTHVWQFQKGNNVFGKGALLACRSFFGTESVTTINPYAYDIRKTPTIYRQLSDYNLEAQAEIVADYYAKIYNKKDGEVSAIGQGGRERNKQNWSTRDIQKANEVRYKSILDNTNLKKIWQ